ncbi:FG-GAP and VCBS repeat-containing protein [Streptomyces sp. NBC_01775]|uniref:FG-GAP and VCBS repeat-containing protein n=1 Tax=Streptomyces sp. NBC_01775 TaxID=2975939 RepID=UPI002DD8B60C|nr:FG-GAP and VCBS repeat-containing protein [Streptomyces sp. NBC_01775]WSB77472.1 FG-GAP and VCBS repeat-containing protein [Streptomyces sp. NBC_01775]
MQHKAITARWRSAAATATAGRVIGLTALVAGIAVTGVLTAGAATSKPAAKAKAAVPMADFNADGKADVVTSAPNGKVDGRSEAGYLTVVNGGADGSDTSKRQVVNRSSKGISGKSALGERWGDRSVARDLDGDGATDLVVGSSDTRSGLTLVWGGKGKGLTKGAALSKDLKVSSRVFGAGDFNGDGKSDLVAGDEGGDGDQLRVLYGPFTREGAPASKANLPSGSEFGPDKIVTGDVTGDGLDDVITTNSTEETADPTRVWKGGKEGLSDKPAEVDPAANGTVGDVDNDGFGDLVIRTVPKKNVENLPDDHGTIKVLYGTKDGPSKSRTTTLSQKSKGVPGTNEKGDELGSALSAGDVNGDGYADIAAGLPGEDLGKGAKGRDSGAVIQLFGAKGGLKGTGAKAYHQSTAGVPGGSEAGDRFGSAVTLQDTDGDKHADLSIGAPIESGTTKEPEAGAVWTLLGTDDGLTTKGVVSYGPTALGAPASRAGLGTSFAR